MLQGKILSSKPIKTFVIIRSELMRIRESQLAISALVETQGQLLVEQMARLNQLEERLNTTITTMVNSNITVAQNISSSLSNSSVPIQNSTLAPTPTPTAPSNSTTGSSTGANQTSSASGN